MAIRLLTTTYETVPDPDPDLSYLDASPDDPPEIRATKQARASAYDKGQWSMVGIIARAEITIPVGEGTEVLQTIDSPGTWGVEDDSGEDHLAEIRDGERRILGAMLLALGLPAHALQ